MTTKELERATAELDREFVIDQFQPPDAASAARWRQAKRKPGRPRQGRGVRVISVSLEKGLLEQSDRLARKLGVGRAKLISIGLRAVLNAQGAVSKRQ